MSRTNICPYPLTNTHGNMEKIEASKLIYPDDDFVMELHVKLKRFSEAERHKIIQEEIKKNAKNEFDTEQAATYCGVTPQTIREHIKNYIKCSNGKMLKAFKKEGRRRYTIYKEDLDQYKNNPNKIL